MATWSLSPQHKKSAVEKMFFYKDGKCITIEQGFRWATFKVESDERPLTDEQLKNEDGYELGGIDNDESWEMWEMIDGCWLDIEAYSGDISEEEQAAFEEAWEEDSYCGVEELGWSQDDCEYFYFGPLELTNEDTGEVFKGEPDEAPAVPETLTFEEKVELVKEMEAEVRAEQAEGAKWPFSPPSQPEEDQVLEVTDWFPVSINPVRVGVYEILTKESINWPYPNKGLWDGKKWNFLDHTVTEWRGLAKDPNE
jgi:hypothetical protein